MESGITKLLHKKLFYSLSLQLSYKPPNLKTALSHKNNVYLLFKRQRQRILWISYFICNAELKIYQYSEYRLKSAYSVIYLEKMNLNKKSQSKISSYCFQISYSQPTNYFHLKFILVNLMESCIIYLPRTQSFKKNIFCILTILKKFFLQNMLSNFSAPVFEVILMVLLVKILDLKQQLIPHSVSFYCSYFNTSFLCISC